MRILFASSEVYPFSKTGGLADVVGALPQALVALGHEVLVVSPWYRSLKADPAPLWIGDIDVPFAGGTAPAGIGTLERSGVRYAFVGGDDFRRDALYGYDDDARRFALFTRSVPPVARRLGFEPDVVHANDWHTGYLPLVLEHGWHLPGGWPGTPSVFTVHNVQYQGTSDLAATCWWLRLPGAMADGYMNHFGSANAMQAGLGYAHHVTTVSPTYAEEVMRPEFGYGLDGTFRHVAHKFSGILNGLDTEVWDPATDPLLPSSYTRDDLGGKRDAAQALRQRMGLPADRPVIGVVSRLADQKGIELLLSGADGLLEQGWTVALLGSGDAEQEAQARDLAARNPGAFAAVIDYDEALAHLIYAGADALAIPSRFEPCGLTQMIAMRYGTLPIARATGGLVDTIDHGETGYLFEHYSADGLLWAAGQARQHVGTARWERMMRTAMERDFSWRASAEEYADLYRRLL